MGLGSDSIHCSSTTSRGNYFKGNFHDMASYLSSSSFFFVSLLTRLLCEGYSNNKLGRLAERWMYTRESQGQNRVFLHLSCLNQRESQGVKHRFHFLNIFTIDLCHGAADLLKFDQTRKQNTSLGRTNQV